jgi:hypothetical protein
VNPTDQTVCGPGGDREDDPVDSATSTPKALLVHDGELGDVRALLDDLGVAVDEHRGLPTPDAVGAAADLTIASARRMLELATEPFARRALRIAVLGNDSRTLRTLLQRAGIDLLVRRPVHPAALRLLILHALYRGPEKRRTDRVLVGFPVRYRFRLRRRQAMLLDLSLSGCRLVTEERLDLGQRIALHLPGDIGGGRLRTVTGEVVRARRAEDYCQGRFELAIAFDPGTGEWLRSAVLAHAAGPAALQTIPTEDTRPPAAPGSGNGTPEKPEAADRTGLPEAGPDDAASEPEAAEAASETASERRATPRRALQRHFVAMAEEATRVLIGRDISLGGMRVDRHPALSIGDELSIAVHLRAREAPLVLRARVERDDGDRGLLLHFHQLSPETAERLDRMVDVLPILAVDEATRESEEVIVSSILDLEAP